MAGALARIADFGRRMLAPGKTTAHKAADVYDPELRSWNPIMRSPDAALLPEWRPMVARTQDMIRNHGIASGAVQTHLDNVVAGGLTAVPKPDYKALGIDADIAHDWARGVAAKFRNYADDPDCFCHAGRRLNVSGLIAQGYRSYLTSTEILGTLEWLPPKRRPGARYATAVQTLMPDLLCNPQGTPDSFRMRAGVEMDEMGAPIAYHLRQAHVSDGMFIGAPTFEWKRIEAYTPWGRRNVIHIYDVDEPGQTRGKPGCVAVIAKLRMLDKFEHVAMQNSILNAMYAMAIESSLDHAQVAEALGATERNGSLLEAYVAQQAGFHKDHSIYVDGVKIPHLLPGEKLNFSTSQNQGAAFNQFEEGVLRHIAAGWNLSYEQLSRDYSKTNYSSARAAMLESWRFFTGRRTAIAARFASMIYTAWLEEAIDLGEVLLPAGAPDFYAAKSAWARCSWIGAPRGHIDPLKESEADALLYDKGVMTLEEWCASRGQDWEEVSEQRAREKRTLDRLGLMPAAPGNLPADPGATSPKRYPSDEPASANA